MSKRDNDLAERALQPEPAPPDIFEPPPERLSKIPGRVDRADLAVIIRAVTLQLANWADLDDDSMEKTGRALTEICRAYLVHDRETRRPQP